MLMLTAPTAQARGPDLKLILPSAGLSLAALLPVDSARAGELTITETCPRRRFHNVGGDTLPNMKEIEQKPADFTQEACASPNAEA